MNARKRWLSLALVSSVLLAGIAFVFHLASHAPNEALHFGALFLLSTLILLILALLLTQPLQTSERAPGGTSAKYRLRMLGELLLFLLSSCFILMAVVFLLSALFPSYDFLIAKILFGVLVLPPCFVLFVWWVLTIGPLVCSSLDVESHSISRIGDKIVRLVGRVLPVGMFLLVAIQLLLLMSLVWGRPEFRNADPADPPSLGSQGLDPTQSDGTNEGTFQFQGSSSEPYQFVSTFFTVMAVVFSVGAAVTGWYFTKIESQVQRHIQDISDAKEGILRARVGLSSLLASAIVMNASRQSFPSAISAGLRAIDDPKLQETVLRRDDRFEPSPLSRIHGDHFQLRYACALNDLMRGGPLRRAWLEVNPGLPTLDENDVLRRLRVVYTRHDWVEPGSWQDLTELVGQRDRWVNRLVAATYLCVEAKQLNAQVTVPAIQEADEQKRAIQSALEEGLKMLRKDVPLDHFKYRGYQELPAVQAYHIKLRYLGYLLQVDPGPEPHVGIDHILSFIGDFVRRFAETFLDEQDPGIGCNYMIVLAIFCEVAVYSIAIDRRNATCLRAQEEEDDLSDVGLPRELLRLISPARGERKRRGRRARAGLAEEDETALRKWLHVAKWCQWHASDLLQEIMDRKYRVLSEVTDLYETQDMVRRDLRNLEALLKHYEAAEGSNWKFSRAESEAIGKIRQEHIWLPLKDRWRESRRVVLG